MDRKALAVTEATVATDLHQAGSVLANLTAEVTLGGVVLVDVVTKTGDFVLGEVLGLDCRVDTASLTNLGGGGATDAVNVGECDLRALLTRKIDAINTGQFGSPSLALTLLVARVLADDVNLAMATDDLALVAHLLDRRTYLHLSFLPVVLIRTGSTGGEPGGASSRYVFAQPQA
jgi:hypothetical protein